MIGHPRHDQKPTPDSRAEQKLLCLLEVGNCMPPLYAVIEQDYDMSRGEASQVELEYLINEKRCPIDTVQGVEAFIWNGYTDPHEVFTLVEWIERPENYPPKGGYNPDDLWRALFPKVFSDHQTSRIKDFIVTDTIPNKIRDGK